jgi:hypothetical protein
MNCITGNTTEFIAGEQFDLRLSPFLQEVLCQLQRDENMMKAKIDEWYHLWERYKDASSARELNISLVKFLGKFKYDETMVQSLLKAETERLQNEVLGWMECQEFLLAYRDFLHKHRGDLIAGMLEHIDTADEINNNSSNSSKKNNKAADLKAKIPPFYVTEAQLAAKKLNLVGAASQDGGHGDPMAAEDAYHNCRLNHM